MITEQELARIERRLRRLVEEANDSSGLSLVENAEWAARSLSRVCMEMRALQRLRALEGESRPAPTAICRCALCTGDESDSAG